MGKRSSSSAGAGGPGVEQRLAEALELQRQGNPALAEILYRGVLATEPRHARALCMLGLLQAQKGDLAQAVELVAESVRIAPADPAAQFNLGLLHQQLGDHARALEFFDAALRLRPDAAQVHNSRGVALKNLGRFEEGLAAYDAAVRLVPDYFEALGNRGVALRYLHRHEDAAAAFVAALALRPQSTETRNNLGHALHAMGRYEEALACYAQALQLAPKDPDLLNGYGMALHGLDRFDEALACFERALGADPKSAQAVMNKGVALQELKRHEEARDCYLRALELEPGSTDARLNLGNALVELNQHEQALAQYHAVLAERPHDKDALMNMGNVLRDIHRYAEALGCYDSALALAPSSADVRWNRALCLLADGDFERGWAEFECRRQIASVSDTTRDFDAPLWLGKEPLAGKTLLLHAEQGLGDTIQFCRFVGDVAARGAQVILEVQRPLVSLLQGLEGAHRVVARGDALPAYDYHCPMLSLPHALGVCLQTLSAEPYLHAQPELVDRWRPILSASGRPNIGLVWSGNAAYKRDHLRSIPLATLLEVLPAGATYWSLQKDVSESDAALIEASGGRVRCFDANDFPDTAAQISLMDAVVSVETSITQLAGALGRPVWVLLAYTADWRWMWARDDSPWYGGMKLFRQAAPGNWPSALQPLAARVREEIARTHPP